MANRLEVEIGANIKDYQDKLARALKLTDQLKDKEKELTKAFKSGAISQDKYYKSLASNSSKLQKATKLTTSFKKSLNTTSTNVDSFTKSTANGSSAMLAFSRTVQDAPFGMMGVSNNITNLTEQFGALKNRTGSAGSALKLMLKDLAGFGGITLGISLATSAWLIFGDSIMAAVSDNNSFAKSQKAVNEALTDFYGNSVSKINSYMTILDDVNTSEKQRKNITEELIKVVPSLKKEDFNYGNNLDLVRKKIGAYVLAQASRVEADTLVKENSAKLSKQARIESIKQIEDETKRIQEFRDFLNEEGVRTKRTSITSTYASQGRSTERAATKNEIISDFTNFATELETELAPIQERINQLYGDTFSGGLGNVEDPKFPHSTVIPAITADLKKNLQNGLNGINDVIKSTPLTLADAIPVDQVNEAVNTNLNAVLLNAQSKAEQFTQVINSTLGRSLANTFSSLGESLGNGLKDVDSVITGGLGSLLSSMGDYLIQAGTAAVLAGVLTKTFASVEGIGAGLAAIAGGIVLKGIGSGISNFSGAGDDSSSVAGQGSSYGSGSTYTSGTNSTTSGGMTLVLRGEDLYGSLSNYIGRQQNLGTNLTFS